MVNKHISRYLCKIIYHNFVCKYVLHANLLYEVIFSINVFDL
jgi:hypothetical protein